MAIKNNLLGGTDLTDGTKGEAADWNDTFDAATMRMGSFSFPAELTHTGDTSFTNMVSASFNLSALNGVIIGMKVQCELKTDSANHNSAMDIKINGANFGTGYLTIARTLSITADSDTRAGVIKASSPDDLLQIKGTAYLVAAINPILGLKLLDATTNFQVQLQCNNASQVAYIKNINILVLYMAGVTEV